MQRELIGRRIRKLRGKRPRSEVGRAIGVTRQAIQAYENGDRVPADDIKIKLADYFGVTVQELFYDFKDNETET